MVIFITITKRCIRIGAPGGAESANGGRGDIRKAWRTGASGNPARSFNQKVLSVALDEPWRTEVIDDERWDASDDVSHVGRENQMGS